ncbi:MAG: hypothetical protein JWP74_2086 [Marmoricola sp.]|nr:hypothetical protein [Marmoricola sp.]
MRASLPLGLGTLAVAVLIPLSLIAAPSASAAGLAATRTTAVVPDAPGSVTATTNVRSTTGTLSWTVPGSIGDSPLTGYKITGTPEDDQQVGPGVTSIPLSGLVPGQDYSIDVTAMNSTGSGSASEADLYVKTWMPTAAPTMHLFISGSRLIVEWHTPANPGNADFTDWQVTVNGQAYDSNYGQYTGLALSTPGNGPHTIKLKLLGSADLGSATPTATKSYTFGATAPRITKPSSGKKGGASTATATWKAPAHTNGYPITGYRVIAYRLNSSGQIVGDAITKLLKASTRSFTGSLSKGRYKFKVYAFNSLGATVGSAYSKTVTAR